MKRQPIIIVGMHRSGTSMLTRFINDLGVFMGTDKSENDESEFFQKLNRWLLFQVGAAWDLPEPTSNLDDNFVKNASKMTSNRLNSIWSFQYLGLKRYLVHRGIANISGHWGWKDPRNTLLLKVYKNIYPKAKIVHIYRNPIDVAVSLQTREHKKQFDSISKKNKLKIWLLKYQRLLSHSFVVEDLKKGVDLWEFYTKKALAADSLFENTITIKYEDFLENPKQTLLDLTSFLELDVDMDLIDSVVEKVNANRRFAFIKDPSLVQFYQDIKERPLMKTLGYDNII